MVQTNKQRPGILKSVLEMRAAIEGLTLMGALPLLRRGQAGGGRPVLVVPGFSTSDHSTYFLRKFLNDIGYQAHGWELGINSGLKEEYSRGLEERLHSLFEQSDRQKVSLIGWNIGGMYARALANQRQDLVSQVITLASPFAMASLNGLSQALGRLYSHFNSLDEALELVDTSENWEMTPLVPSTSIFTEGDGITNWRFCIDTNGPRTENIRVSGSHMGMPVNPLVYYVIADRLAEDPEHWHRFDDKHRGEAVLNTMIETRLGAA